jgi:hypothetical protein
MSEWWTYTISDFLMYSPRTYYRMLERYNDAIWPGQIVTLGLGLAMLVLLRRPSPRQGRILSGLVALLWGMVGWGFLWRRYASINWAATYFALAFALELLLFVWIGGFRGRLRFSVSRDPPGVLGTVLFVVSLLIYPLFASLFGRPWQQADVFGIEPDPTVVGTLGLLLLGRGHSRWLLLPVPILWSLFSGTMLLAMGSPEAWAPLLAVLLVLVGSVLPRTAEPAA